MANKLSIRLRGNDIDRVFQRAGLNNQVIARFMGKGLGEAAKDVRQQLKPRIPRGKTRYLKVRGKRERIEGGKLQASVRSRRVARLINGVRVSGSGAVVGYGINRAGSRGTTSFYAHFLEYGTSQRRQKTTGRRLGRLRAHRLLQKTISARRNVSESIMLRETRREFLKQVRLAKGGFKSLDKTLLRHI